MSDPLPALTPDELVAQTRLHAVLRKTDELKVEVRRLQADNAQLTELLTALVSGENAPVFWSDDTPPVALCWYCGCVLQHQRHNADCELLLARAVLRPAATGERQSTHWLNCWKAHPDCAEAKIANLEERLEAAANQAITFKVERDALKEAARDWVYKDHACWMALHNPGESPDWARLSIEVNEASSRLYEAVESVCGPHPWRKRQAPQEATHE